MGSIKRGLIGYSTTVCPFQRRMVVRGCLASGTLRLNLVDGGGYLLFSLILSHKTATSISPQGKYELNIILGIRIMVCIVILSRQCPCTCTPQLIMSALSTELLLSCHVFECAIVLLLTVGCCPSSERNQPAYRFHPCFVHRETADATCQRNNSRRQGVLLVVDAGTL